jgi:hypothetical protein
MDFPLHQHYTDRHQDNTPSSNNFSSYQVFNDRSTNLYEEENSRSSNMILLSTRSPQGLNHSWNQPLHTTYNPSNVQQPQIQNMPHSERGIAGFVQKLYQ